MARWKARVEFLLNVIELLFLSLTVEALQGKTCRNSLLSGGAGSVWGKIWGRRVVPREYFLVSRKLDTFCYLTQTAPSYVQSFWHNTGVWRTDGRTERQTDGQTNGIAIASTALAMGALRRAVKKPCLETVSRQDTCLETASLVQKSHSFGNRGSCLTSAKNQDRRYRQCWTHCGMVNQQTIMSIHIAWSA